MAAPTFARSKQRVEAEACWLLHSYPYKETSLILDVFSRHHGRVAMVARGARRPASALRGNLLAFQPLHISWFGAAELKTLHAAEWQGGVPQLAGLPLICGFYLNELLLRLLARDDAHPNLFDAYRDAIASLAQPACQVEPLLRGFERAMLAELGYGLQLDRDVDGREVNSQGEYVFVPRLGLVEATTANPTSGIRLSGACLEDLRSGAFRNTVNAQQAKLLMRTLLSDLLGDAPLHTRNILRDLHKL